MALYERTVHDTSRSMGRPIADPSVAEQLARAQALAALTRGGGGGGGGGGAMPPPETAADKNQEFIRRQLVNEMMQAQRQELALQQGGFADTGGVRQLSAHPQAGQVSIHDAPNYGAQLFSPDRESQVFDSLFDLKRERQAEQDRMDARSLLAQKLAESQAKIEGDKRTHDLETYKANVAADAARNQYDLGLKELEVEKARIPKIPNALQQEEMEAASRARVMELMQTLPDGDEGLRTGEFSQEFAEALQRRLPLLTEREQEIAKKMLEAGGFTKSKDLGLKEYWASLFGGPLGLAGAIGLDYSDLLKDTAPLLDKRKVRSPLERLYDLLTQ